MHRFKASLCLRARAHRGIPRVHTCPHEGKNRIIAQITSTEGLNGALGKVTFFSAQHDLRLAGPSPVVFQYPFQAAG